jgi:DNA-binding MarR family transcriptional regulator
MWVMERRQDDVDRHVARWVGQLDGMDPEVEGAITRMQAVLRRLTRMHQEAAEGSELTIEDYKTLHALMIQPYPTEATPAQLADTCHVTRAAMTSRLDRIAGAGLVTRTPDRADRRRIIVRPTADGRRTWERHVAESMGREAYVLRALSPSEKQRLNALLRKVLLSLEE